MLTEITSAVKEIKEGKVGFRKDNIAKLPLESLNCFPSNVCCIFLYPRIIDQEQVIIQMEM